jgi:hypothetical protein
MLISILSRKQHAQPPSGGGGSPSSALDSPSTVVYNPEPITGSNIACTLPTSWLDTRYDQGGTALTWASDITLTDFGNAATNSADLQTKMNDSLTRSGHSRIKLPDGYVAEGIHVCGVHTQGAYWTYIQRSTRGTEGTRCTSAQMSGAPIIRVTASNRGAIETLVGANYWRFDDIKFETTATESHTMLNIASLDVNGDNTGSSATDLPDHIYFSRCWIQGKNNATGDVKNGIILNTRACAFVDGIIDQIWKTGTEAHAIASNTAQGPMKIVNNYLECASITVLFGGTNPYFNNVVPTDIEFRRNHLTLRDSWNPFHASHDGITRVIKNRLEFKFGIRALVEGNVLEKSPLDGQKGEAFVVKSMAGESGLVASWYKTQDICIRYNIARDLWNWVYVTGVQRPEVETLGGTSRVAFMHNLVHNTASSAYGTGTTFSAILGDVPDLAFDHMTVIPRTADVTAFTPSFCLWTAELPSSCMPRLIVRDSILHSGRYDFPSNKWAFTNQAADGETELARVSSSNYTLQNTIIIAGPSAAFPSGEVTFPADIAAVNFTSDNPASGLDSDSPAKNAATDGTDLGCDYTKVNLATSGVVI